MADSYVQVAPNGGGALIDTSQLTVSGNTVQRQNIVVADPNNANNVSYVLNYAPVGTEYALIVRNIPSGTQPVSGTITTSGSTAAGGLASTAGSPTLDGGTDGTYVRTLLTDVNGSQTVVGSPYFSAAVQVKGQGASQPDDGISEMLMNIYRELKQMNFFLKQLPLYLNGGQTFRDEDGDFRDDVTLFQ